jgi:geranylgeranyl pyrophosphate synthase
VTLADIIAPISAELSLVDAALLDCQGIAHESLAHAIDYIVSSGGKRVRPALVLLATRLYPTELTKAISLAAAVEALHTAALVHDDVVDHAHLRRGRPTINTSWNTSVAVLVGDYLFARAAGFAASTHSVTIMELFADVLRTMVDGEIRELCRERNCPPARTDYYHRIFQKTASLFALGAEASGVIMEASQAETAALREYGCSIGMAFQIVDDVLDFVADETLGKPTSSDLRQGVMTLPVYCFADAQPGHPALQRYWDLGCENGAAVDALVAAIRGSSAVGEALAEAGRFGARAGSALDPLPDTPARESLRALATYVATRSV